MFKRFGSSLEAHLKLFWNSHWKCFNNQMPAWNPACRLGGQICVIWLELSRDSTHAAFQSVPVSKHCCFEPKNCILCTHSTAICRRTFISRTKAAAPTQHDSWTWFLNENELVEALKSEQADMRLSSCLLSSHSFHCYLNKIGWLFNEDPVQPTLMDTVHSSTRQMI